VRDAGIDAAATRRGRVRLHDLRHYPDNRIIPTGHVFAARPNGPLPGRPLAEAG